MALIQWFTVPSYINEMGIKNTRAAWRDVRGHGMVMDRVLLQGVIRV